MKTILSVLAVLALAGCTSNTRARAWGGEAEMKLPPCVKLVNMTWKNTDIWYLTRPMRSDEKPETWTFDESSDWGVMSGKIVIKEQACNASKPGGVDEQLPEGR